MESVRTIWHTIVHCALFRARSVRMCTFLRAVPVLVVCFAILGFARPVDALTISPVTLEFRGEPGQTVISDMELYNEEVVERTFYASSQNFEARGESGTPFFMTEQIGFATWIKADPAEYTLAPSQRLTVPFRVEIPQDAEPGGHFAALLWGTQPPVPEGEGEGVSVVGGKVGMLILLSVGGDVEEGGGLLSFDAVGGNRQNMLPISFALRYGNDGSERVRPVGTITIRDIFGRVVGELGVNQQRGNILPHSVRKFESAWNQKGQAVDDPTTLTPVDDRERTFLEIVRLQWEQLLIGPYRAELELKYGPAMGDVVRSEISFSVYPWEFLVTVGVSAFVIILLLVLFVRQYNRWIIGKALQMQGIKPQQQKSAKKKAPAKRSAAKKKTTSRATTKSQQGAGKQPPAKRVAATKAKRAPPTPAETKSPKKVVKRKAQKNRGTPPIEPEGDQTAT
ncbi:MAG: hypothetical protein ABIG71_00870 [Candidatus Uhrbacteria bacterium]